MAKNTKLSMAVSAKEKSLNSITHQTQKQIWAREKNCDKLLNPKKYSRDDL